MGVSEVPNILQICFTDSWKHGAFDFFTSDKSSAYLNVHLSELNMTKLGVGSRHNFQKSVGIGSKANGHRGVLHTLAPRRPVLQALRCLGIP